MAQEWPTGVNSSFQKTSFNFSPGNGVIVSTTDTGLAKRRRRYTATVDKYTGVIIMTSTELSSFRTWYADTILDGSLSFNFPDPFNLSSTIEVRFAISNNGNGFTVKPDGETLDYQVSFSLEKLP